MRFRLIEDQRDVWPVRVLCDALGVSPSGYYAWRSRPESPREIANRELPSDIRRVHAEHRGRYGGPRIHAELRAAGQSVSRKRIERVMRRHGIRAHVPPRSRVCTTDSKHSLPIAATLRDRKFVAEKHRRLGADRQGCRRRLPGRPPARSDRWGSGVLHWRRRLRPRRRLHRRRGPPSRRGRGRAAALWRGAEQGSRDCAHASGMPIYDASPSTGAWAGKGCRDTTGALWWRLTSQDGSVLSAMGSIRKRTGDRRPRWPSRPTC